MSMDPTRLESLGDADDFRIYGVQSMQPSRRVPAAQGKEVGWLRLGVGSRVRLRREQRQLEARVAQRANTLYEDHFLAVSSDLTF
jgi:hypothetical protein